MQPSAEVYYINGSFLVFSRIHAIELRSKRIIGQLIGCSPKSPHQLNVSGLPCHLSHYAARIVFDRQLATFKELIYRDVGDQSLADRQQRYLNRIKTMKHDARRMFVEKRTSELKKRGINVTAERIGDIDECKFRVSVRDVPDPEISLMLSRDLDPTKILNLLHTDDDKMELFRDLYMKGFYVTSGTKFGCDFLAYPRDPVRYHAQFAITVAPCTNGEVDFSRINYNNINASHRLCHSVNKIFVLATISRDNSKFRVDYWTLYEKTFLAAEHDKSVMTRYNLSLPREIDPLLIKSQDEIVSCPPDKTIRTSFTDC